MKSILLVITLLIGLPALCADTPIAVVRGTNVLFTAIADTNRFVPPAGASNIIISAAEVGVITKGWSYSGGEFRDPKGSPIANGIKTRIDRSKLIDAAIADMVILQDKTVKATWDAMATSNKLEVVRIGLSRLGMVMEKLLIEKRNELFELKEAE